MVARLPNLRFNNEVQGVLHDPDSNTYLVTGQHAATGERFMVRCRKLVLGLGSQPSLPACCDRRAAPYIHSADYLRNKAQLQQRDPSPSWAAARARPRSFTTCCATAPDTTTAWPGSRARRAFPDGEHQAHAGTDLARLHRVFLRSAEARRRQILAQQSSLYKGINASLINQIYDLLDEKIHDGDRRYTLLTNSELRACRYDRAQARYHLEFQHVDYAQPFSHVTDGLVLATGYAHSIPACINPIHDRIAWNEDGSYRIGRNYAIDHDGGEIYVQNTGLLSHGVTSGPGLLLPPQLADPARADRRGALPGRGPHRCRSSARPPAACWRIARTGAPPASACMPPRPS